MAWTSSEGGENIIPCEARGVGLVFQEYALFPHMTVRERMSPTVSASQILGALRGSLTLVGIGTEASPTETSCPAVGGQQQRRPRPRPGTETRPLAPR